MHGRCTRGEALGGCARSGETVAAPHEPRTKATGAALGLARKLGSGGGRTRQVLLALCGGGGGGTLCATIHGGEHELGADAGVDQGIHNYLVAGVERIVAGTPTRAVDGIPWRARLQQRLDHLTVASPGSQHERGCTIDGLLRMRRDTILEQLEHLRERARARRAVQPRQAVGRVDVVALLHFFNTVIPRAVE